MKILSTRNRVISCCLQTLLLFSSCYAQKLVVQTGHQNNVKAAAYSSDGRMLATREDGTIKLWDAPTGMLIRTIPDLGPTGVLAFCRNNAYLLSGGLQGSIRIWEVASGMRRPGISGNLVAAVAPTSADILAVADNRKGLYILNLAVGRQITVSASLNCVRKVALADRATYLATVDTKRIVKLWSPRTKRSIHALPPLNEDVANIAFSPDSRFLVASSGRRVLIWTLPALGKHNSLVFQNRVTAIAFDPARPNILAVGCKECKTVFCDIETGKKLFPKAEAPSLSWPESSEWISFSQDGRFFVGVGDRPQVVSYNVQTHEQGVEYTCDTWEVKSLAYSPDRRWLATGNDDQTVRLWDLATGSQKATIVPGRFASSLAFSGDSRKLACHDYGSIYVWDLDSEKPTMVWKDRRVSGPVAISPKLPLLASGSLDGKISVWNLDTDTKTTLSSEAVQGTGFLDIKFSPDGTMLAASAVHDHQGSVYIWDVDASGHMVARLPLPTQGKVMRAIAFSPAQGALATGDAEGYVQVWDVQKAEQTDSFSTGCKEMSSLTFNQDGHSLVCGNQHGVFVCRASGDHACTVIKTPAPVNLVTYSPDGGVIAAAVADGSTRLYPADSTSRKELCLLYSFNALSTFKVVRDTRSFDTSPSWAVVDQLGRFDASNAGEVDQLHWVIGNEPIRLSQFADRYYDPGLLAKYAGLSEQKPRDVESLTGVKLYPSITIVRGAVASKDIAVTLADRGGGIGSTSLFINGKCVEDEVALRALPDHPGQSSFTIDLARIGRFLVPGQDNVLGVSAFDGKNAVCSRQAELRLKPPGTPPTPKLWTLVAGVSGYSDSGIRLFFPATDAEDFAKVMNVAAEGFGIAPPNQRLLLTPFVGDPHEASGIPGVTKANLLARLRVLADPAHGPGSNDMVVVYLSGHGANRGGPGGDYYYLTESAEGADLDNPRPEVSLSASEIRNLLKESSANKQLVILDTCYAGAFGGLYARGHRSPDLSNEACWRKMLSHHGAHVLGACTACQEAYESARYGRGFLTMAILKGLREGLSAPGDQWVKVLALLDYSKKEAERIARTEGVVQTVVELHAARSQDFTIGRIINRELIPVFPPAGSPRHLISCGEFRVRSDTQHPYDSHDPLHLTEVVADALQRITATRSQLLAFCLSPGRGVHTLSGEYTVAHGKITIKAWLAPEGPEPSEITFCPTSLDSASLDGLACELLNEVGRRLQAKQ